MLLDLSKFVVKGQSSMLSSKKSFEILDESGKVVGTATDTTGFLAGLFGGTVIEVRDSSNNELQFSQTRTGFFMKKDEVKDPKGDVIGRYKAKMFTLSGGFQIYDNAGKHLPFLSPEKAEMGTVPKTWGGMAKELFTGGSNYGVQIDPKYASDRTAKILILAASIAAETIVKPKKESGSSLTGGGDE